MKKTIPIGESLADFFGTYDENIKYLESLLDVEVHIRENDLTVEGASEQVGLVERLIADYLTLRKRACGFPATTSRRSFASYPRTDR